VNAAGARKLVGIGQRVVAGGSHTGSVIVVEDGDRIRRVLGPVYSALSLGWDPETVGAVDEEAPGATWATVRDALLAEYGARYELVSGSLDDETLALARDLAPEH
jgi:lipoate-protein ligase A